MNGGMLAVSAYLKKYAPENLCLIVWQIGLGGMENE
jgi:hypothetical protein